MGHHRLGNFKIQAIAYFPNRPTEARPAPKDPERTASFVIMRAAAVTQSDRRLTLSRPPY
jgi:hypothetical protein